MTREIERKFLLKRMPERLDRYPHAEIEQGYLALEPADGVQVRLRRKRRSYSLTYKRGRKMNREEREVKISAKQFNALWPATDGRRLRKIRYDVPWKEWTIEIDIYLGRHDGLIVAEVEFDDDRTCEAFTPPDWLGQEVTGKSRYSNVALALR